MTLAMPISGRLTYPGGKRGAHQLNKLNCSATAMHEYTLPGGPVNARLRRVVNDNVIDNDHCCTTDILIQWARHEWNPAHKRTRPAQHF